MNYMDASTYSTASGVHGMNLAHICNDRLQTVEQHCDGVAMRAAEFAKTIGAENIARLAGYIHDMGKNCKRFDDYIRMASDEKKGDIDHAYAGARYICEIADEKDAKDSAVSRLIAHIVASHHGLCDWLDKYGDDTLKKRIEKDESYSEIVSNTEKYKNKKELTDLLDSANDEYVNLFKKIREISQDGKKEICVSFYHGMLERYMQSVLVDSDYIDTANFMTNSSTDNDEGRNYNNFWESISEDLESILCKFSDFSDPISLKRSEISDKCLLCADEPTKIRRLVVETGLGKTYSSMRFAVNHAKIYGKKKIFYIAPFMSILEQNSDVIREIVGNGNFLEHYSDFFARIENEDEKTEYTMRTDKWDVPVISTTMVQFLNTLFSNKMRSVRRMHRLSDSVIIIDEVQSLPIKCVHIFNLAVNFLSEICGCTIVLCSATQPCFEEAKFPILPPENMTDGIAPLSKENGRTEIIPDIKGFTFESASVFCKEKYEQNGNLLVVVNTKASAKTLYEMLKEYDYDEKPTLIHLSTNMCAAHRKKQINLMKQLLANHKPIICVTTQLIEAGVDISFGCVVRSLAGFDSITQAAGRCNRHGEQGKRCPVYVIDITEEKVSRLEGLNSARSCSRNVILNDSCKSNLSDNYAIDMYYKKFFSENKEKMSYNVKNGNILDYLSCNKNRDRSVDNKHRFLHQAFKTAGECFEVIDNNTTDIIVPYNEEAENLICDICSETDLSKLSRLIRKAQKYIVSIYDNTETALAEKGALIKHNSGCVILDKRFYDLDLGVTLDAAQMDILLC